MIDRITTVPLIAPALTASLCLAVMLRFLSPLPTLSPNLGGAIELGGSASGLPQG